MGQAVRKNHKITRWFRH